MLELQIVHRCGTYWASPKLSNCEWQQYRCVFLTDLLITRLLSLMTRVSVNGYSNYNSGWQTLINKTSSISLSFSLLLSLPYILCSFITEAGIPKQNIRSLPGKKRQSRDTRSFHWQHMKAVSQLSILNQVHGSRAREIQSLDFHQQWCTQDQNKEGLHGEMEGERRDIRAGIGLGGKEAWSKGDLEGTYSSPIAVSLRINGEVWTKPSLLS